MTRTDYLLQESKDTQDSLALYDAMRDELGLSGRTCENGSGKLASASIEQSASSEENNATGRSVEDAQVQTRLDEQTTTNHVDRYVSAADSGVIHVPKPYESSREEQSEHASVEPRPSTTKPHDDRLLKPSNDFAAPPRKMDVSQQTPTQANEDRDYTDLPDTLPSTGHDGSKPNIEDQEQERTLNPEDTGAVNFGDLSQFARPSSQVSEDGGFGTAVGNWRASEQFSGPAYTPFKPNGVAPETPAVPRNPFGAKPDIAAPFAGSQLFGQTQFSSAFKPNAISPTSSRPSPNIVHNSISPNVAETSPLKNRANVSSPTDVRSSSPNRVDDVPATVCKPPALARIEEETPYHVRSLREDAIPQSPSHPPPKSSGNRQPLARYESMKTSQERKPQADFSYTFVGSDSDDDPITRQVARRKRVEKKKAQAAQEMERVRYTPRSRPSSRDQPENKRRRTSAEDDVQITHVSRSKSGEALEGSLEQSLVVADSQQREDSSAQHLIDEGSTQDIEDAEPEAEPNQMNQETAVDAGQEHSELDDNMLVPASSPPAPSAPYIEQDGIPRSDPDLPQLTNEPLKTSNETGTSSMPPVRHRSLMQYGRKPRRRVISSSASELPSKETGISSDHTSPSSSPASTAVPENEPHKEQNGDVKTPENHRNGRRKGGSSARRSKTKSSSSRKAARSGRTKQQKDSEDATSPSALDADSSMSSLSSVPESIISTPTALREETPTHDGPPCTAASLNLSSSASRQSLRQRAMKPEASSVSPQTKMRYARAAKSHAPFYGSQSTDELALSPSNSVMEKSMIQTKPTKTIRASTVSTARGGRIFEGMAFAISFQTSKSKSQEREKLETRILQAGGTILADGFEELFETPPIISATEPVLDIDEPMALAGAHGQTGFAALIADSHSRKAKYMQALALGIPCLAHQWITTSLSKGRALDWEPYLLCSGASAVLGNALRSRNLTPYAAHDARLSETIDQRRKLLEDQRILIVVTSKNQRSEAKRPYIFLTHALGPVASRVFTTEQAREALKQHAREGRPFDWVYVDKGTGPLESVVPGPAKKRKRSGTRVLDDELIVQSLILGRMVEEDEVCF